MAGVVLGDVDELLRRLQGGNSWPEGSAGAKQAERDALVVQTLVRSLEWYGNVDLYDDDGALWVGEPEDDTTWELDQGQEARAALAFRVAR